MIASIIKTIGLIFRILKEKYVVNVNINNVNKK